jgi:CubicO group peptidase (beta-lactamase class C family)
MPMSKLRFQIILAVCLFILSLLAHEASSQELGDALHRAIESTENGEFAKQHSILVYKDGELIVERYWSGKDGWRGKRDFNATSLHDLRSCSKSVVGLLVGTAIEEKLIPADLGVEAHTLFPDKKLELSGALSEGHRSITLEHLLNMTDGLDWQQHETEDHVNNEAKMEGAPDSVDYVWSQPMKRQPGKEFNYNSGATVLLAGAIKRAAGRDIEQYAAEKLFKPMDIKEWEWMRDTDKEPAAHCGLRMTSRDMVKIGRLILQKGKWNGAQLVPKSWIETTIDHQNGSRKYVNQWSLENFWVGDKKERQVRAIVAYGKGGQDIFVLPEQNAVVVFTAGYYDDGKASGDSIRFFKRKIIPLLAPPASAE